MRFLKLSTTMCVGLLLFGTLLLFGCLKEGVLENSFDDIQLVVVPSAKEVDVGDKVNFDILLLGEIVDADLYIDSSKISGHEYIFQESGIYTVYAQKEGVKNSDNVKIMVGGDFEELKLSIVGSMQSPSGSKIYIFQTEVGGDTTSADIYVDNEKISGKSHTFAPRQYPYFVYAKKTGLLNSDTLEINIPLASGPKLFIKASVTEAKMGEEVSFTAGYVNVEPIMINADFYVDEIKISKDKYKFEEKGTYTVIAKKESYQDSDPITITVSENTNSLNVKVVGFKGKNSSSKAMLWEGSASQAVTLGDGVATGIFNFYGGIYVSGHEFNGSGNTINAKYWDSNQDEVILESGNSQANSVMVEPGDGGVVIGGSIGSDAVYWVWGQSEKIGSMQGAEIALNDAIWEDGYIYAVGNTVENGKSAATIWALGDRWGLYHDGDSYANAIVVKDGDYYVAGGVINNYMLDAVFWKGGNIHSLSTPGGLASMANDIVVKDNNIYVAGSFTNGFERDNAVVWINNGMTILSDSNEFGSANAIAVASDGTIFVAGWTSSTPFSDRTAVYWQVDESGNVTKRVNLTDGNSNAEATCIALGN